MIGIRLLVGALFAGAVCSRTLDARAEPAHLIWNAPEGCPTEAALRAEVTRFLGDTALDQGGFDAHASVTPGATGGFTLVLWVRARGSEGSRTLSAPTCDTLLNVAAFSIALAVNPELAATPATAAPEPDDEKLPAPPTPPAQAPPHPEGTAPSTAASASTPARAPTPAPAPEWWLGARVVGDTSLLPSPALGLGLTADALLIGVVRLGVSGQAFLPQEERLSDGGGGLFTLWAVEAHACYEPSFAVRIGACPLVQAGAVRGRGRGVDHALDQTSTVVAPGVAIVGRVPLGPGWAAVFGGAALFPLSHDRFVVSSGQVHEIPAFSAQGLLGVELRAF